MEDNSYSLEIEIKYALKGSIEDWKNSFAKKIGVNSILVDKEDSYYEINNFFFRIRKDLTGYVCTFKDKRMSGSLEVNQEWEANLQDISFWSHFIERAQAKLIYKKTKKGFSFESRNFFLELVDVSSLGLFAEIEYRGKKQDIHSIYRDLEDFSLSIGLTSSMIETRSYKELLLSFI